MSTVVDFIFGSTDKKNDKNKTANKNIPEISSAKKTLNELIVTKKNKPKKIRCPSCFKEFTRLGSENRERFKTDLRGRQTLAQN